MTGKTAADLPVHSIIAKGSRVYLKGDTHADLPWIYMEAGLVFTNCADDDDLDAELADGAVVLREGY